MSKSKYDNILVHYWYENGGNGGSFILKGAKCFSDIDEALEKEVPNYFWADYWDLNKHPDMEVDVKVIHV